MELSPLTAVSPVDGRYAGKTESLREYFSEFALIRYRIRVEIEYFIALCEIPLPQLADFDRNLFETLRDIYRTITPEEAMRVKEIEKVTNHDVKAIEYYIKEHFKTLGISKWGEFVHFGLTSQDINNTSVPLSFKEAMEEVYLPALQEIVDTIGKMSEEWKDIPMLAKTHGQPASPTRVGKEFKVFHVRLLEQLRQLSLLEYPAKFGGATGNMNAHKVAYPGIDWIESAIPLHTKEAPNVTIMAGTFLLYITYPINGYAASTSSMATAPSTGLSNRNVQQRTLTRPQKFPTPRSTWLSPIINVCDSAHMTSAAKPVTISWTPYALRSKGDCVAHTP